MLGLSAEVTVYFMSQLLTVIILTKGRIACRGAIEIQMNPLLNAVY